ncbi:MAG: leucine-rich repeat domain-containing protein [Eubacteriales bacterium]|nr:leucine-rich repeat domain-containing protein [Eubacteriales bacterium]
MKKKLLAVLLSGMLSISGTIPAFAASDIFTAAEAEITEAPEATVVIDGVTYTYDSAEDAYMIQKGDNRQKVTLKDSVNGKSVTTIKEGAFANCVLLEYIEAPDSIKNIESRAFSGCYNLGVYSVTGDGCFSPAGVIAPDAFEGVECVTFRESYETGSRVLSAFAKSHNFHYIAVDDYIQFTNKNGIYYVGLQTAAFGSRTLAGSVKIEFPYDDIEYINEIGHHAFHRCSKITEITIPNYGTRKIDDYAFAECTALRKITLPASITYISPTAFSGSDSVTIYSAKGSYVESYAKEHGIPFKATNTETMTAPSVSSVKVSGNSATVTRGKASENAAKYQFAIGKSADSVSKGQFYRTPRETSEFYYLQKGTYYAFCRGIRTDSTGKTVYGPWSAGKKFKITATTPSKPRITRVSVSGKTVKVTYTKCTNATGYDVVLGKRMGNINGEKRPLDYGKLVKKATNGSTVTVTFTNVPKGTYYAGLHAYNRTGSNNSKVFGFWSAAKTVKVR